jgi:hypothetical protein
MAGDVGEVDSAVGVAGGDHGAPAGVGGQPGRLEPDRDSAALAATVITYRPRSALRDVGKAMSLPQDSRDFH